MPLSIIISEGLILWRGTFVKGSSKLKQVLVVPIPDKDMSANEKKEKKTSQQKFPNKVQATVSLLTNL